MSLLLLPACLSWSTDDLDGDGHSAADCDDLDPSIYPGAVDASGDGVDSDCDGADGVDADGDGFTAIGSGGADCDDSDPTVSPAGEEVCDGIDNDCDGDTDEPGALDGEPGYRDGDGDGYGTTAERLCAETDGFSADDGDCDDADASVHPGAVEICDGIDNDCDSTTDAGVTFYADSDGDGEGDPGAPVVADCDGDTDGLVEGAEDCDDGDAAISPQATELCDDDRDNDCSGMVDDCDASTAPIARTAGENDGLGLDLAILDADLDGAADLLVGFAAPETARPGYWLQLGPITATASVTPEATLTLDSALPWSGSSTLTSPGDLDGDGAADLLWFTADVTLDAQDRDAIFQISGPITAAQEVTAADLLLSAETTWRLNASAFTDLTGDGVPDLLLSEESDSGRLLLYAGPIAGPLEDDGADIVIENSGTQLRLEQAGVDLNGDGLDDLLLRIEGGAGRICSFLGPLTADGADAEADHCIYGLDEGDQLASGQWAGDSDGDGYTDLWLAASYVNTDVFNAGAAYLLSGPDGLTADDLAEDASAIINGTTTNGYLHLAAATDLNHDGLMDLLLSQDTHSNGGQSPDTLSLVLGRSGMSGTTRLDEVTELSILAEDYADLAVGSDLTGDGCGDLLIGQPDWSGSGSDAGAVWIFPGWLP